MGWYRREKFGPAIHMLKSSSQNGTIELHENQQNVVGVYVAEDKRWRIMKNKLRDFRVRVRPIREVKKEKPLAFRHLVDKAMDVVPRPS